MTTLHKLLSSLLLAVGLCLATASQAANYQGFQFDDAVQIDGTDLRLNGLGTRAVLFIQGYAAGLYLTDKVNSGPAVIGVKGPKRLQIRMLRQAEAADFRKAFINGMRKNAGEAGLPALKERIERFEAVIETIGTVRKGDTINLDFSPARGMVMSLNGNAKGRPIEGADFFNTLLEIFVGETPVDSNLRKGLLGL